MLRPGPEEALCQVLEEVDFYPGLKAEAGWLPRDKSKGRGWDLVWVSVRVRTEDNAPYS